MYFLNLPLQLLTDDAATTYVVSLFIILFLMGSGFYLGFRFRFGRAAALVGALFATYGPYNFMAIDPQGRWPALMALAFVPVLVAAYLNLLDRPTRTSFAVAAVSSGLALIAHPLVLYAALVGLAKEDRVAAFLPVQDESELLDDPNELVSLELRQAGHRSRPRLR